MLAVGCDVGDAVGLVAVREDGRGWMCGGGLDGLEGLGGPGGLRGV